MSRVPPKADIGGTLENTAPGLADKRHITKRMVGCIYCAGHGARRRRISENLEGPSTACVQTPQPQGSTEAFLVCARRSGKSFVLALIAVYLATFKDWRRYLGPGELGTVMVVAADRKQARTILRYVKGLIQGSPMLAGMIESETAESITLRQRIVIEVHSGSLKTTRGYSLIAAPVCTENLNPNILVMKSAKDRV
jgi:hypothetical protein